MPVSPGTRLGPYEILSPIGAGGMGEVYKARDTRLDRTVAVKVLPSHLSSNPQLRERFDREARAISSLSHPHICTLFDVGHQDGVDYLVMELLEGESLVDRLARGPLPIAEALRYGAQISEALAKAHKQGIVHRDLKPGNVMLTKSGAKLLDFGLAKASLAIITSPDSPTRPLTAEGTIVGTFQYMAPEQIEGLEADARTDIFALGAVLYEMATGRRAFDGKTKTSLIAAIVAGEPRRIEELQPLAPRGFAHVVDKCLEKDPDDRWQSAHDVAEELKWIAESGPMEVVSAESTGRSRRRTAAAAVVLLLLGSGAGFVAARYLRDSEPEALLQSSIVPPRGVEVSPTQSDDPVVLSPDGGTIAFTGLDSSGKKLLWLRSLSEIDARPLTATEGARHPFWSPDGQSIAFFSQGKLRKIALDGSPPVAICEVASNPMRGSWNREGIILFSPASGAPIHQVSAAGGRSAGVTKLAAGETTHRWARFLPDGKSFLYVAGSHDVPESSEVNAVYASKLGSLDRKLILRARSNVEYVDGQLLFVRNNTLLAQRFDPKRLEIEGPPVSIAKNVHYSSDSFFSSFSISGNRLVYTTAETIKKRQFVWLDGDGKQTGTIAGPGEYRQWALSPDRKTLAITIEDPAVGHDIWLHDLSHGSPTRLTLGGSASQTAWSPDGKRIAYWGDKDSIYARNVEGEEGSELLWKMAHHWGGPVSWSPDGRYLTLWSFDPKTATGYDAFILPLFGERKLIPLANTTASEFGWWFSPDGRWLLYLSDETGRDEVYVTSFPDLNVRKQISLAGGGNYYPTWAGAREIWYRQKDGTWVAVTLEERAGSSPAVSAPRTLFRDPQILSLEPSAEKGRLLAMRETGDESPPQIVLVSRWKQLLNSQRP